MFFTQRILFTTLLFLSLIGSTAAQTLTLEYAQEGEPSQPRALIVIHDALKDRESLSLFLRTWGDRDRGWARSQYCSVYSYEFPGGFQTLDDPETLAADLLDRISRDRFDSATSDRVNPNPKVFPFDGRQPLPSLKSRRTEILLAGVGYGGLVARELELQARRDKRRVTRVAYLSTPLDGLSALEFALVFPRLVPLSAGWKSLFELFQQATVSGQADYGSTVSVVAASVQPSPFEPSDNVLYGRGTALGHERKKSNGLYGYLSMAGAYTGPDTEIPLQKTDGQAQGELGQPYVEVILTKLVDQEVTFDYLWRRQQIEDYIKAGGLDPLYIYWDERDNRYTLPQWREAYASREGLYEMMWY